MNIIMFNGLLLFLLFMWTSAETGPETEHTEGLQMYANESRVDIQARKVKCTNLGGKCIKKRKSCPLSLLLETEPGRPYCSKNHRCCYPGTSSCNLVWNYKEERPLIMIRESKTIVPPVMEKYISDDPNRILIGRKLIFACPGDNNQFNHVTGSHSKLHGECISHEQFKVCVNNYPEILDLSQLSCSRKMFPSFIKEDNDTSDKKSCEGIGGQLYKTGYTYGDYHEFKDLKIEVCFHEKNQTTLCTSPNLNGNKTDYRTTEPSGVDLQTPRKPDTCSTECVTPPRCRDEGPKYGGEAKCIPTKSKCDIKKEDEKLGICQIGAKCKCCVPKCQLADLCKAEGKRHRIKTECMRDEQRCDGEKDPHLCNNDCKCCIPNIDCSQKMAPCDALDRWAECKPNTHLGITECRNSGRLFDTTAGMCKDKRCGCCYMASACPNSRFLRNHVCPNCNDAASAAIFSFNARTNPYGGERINTVFSNANQNNRITYTIRGQTCEMNNYVKTWQCTRPNTSVPFNCVPKQGGCCKGTSATDIGTLHPNPDCRPLSQAGNCIGV